MPAKIDNNARNAITQAAVTLAVAAQDAPGNRDPRTRTIKELLDDYVEASSIVEKTYTNIA